MFCLGFGFLEIRSREIKMSELLLGALALEGRVLNIWIVTVVVFMQAW